jgi:hypothetical protein
MRRFEVVSVRYGRGHDVYVIDKVPEGMTHNKIIDECDFANWGGRVVPLGGGRYEVTVYTD